MSYWCLLWVCRCWHAILTGLHDAWLMQTAALELDKTMPVREVWFLCVGSQHSPTSGVLLFAFYQRAVVSFLRDVTIVPWWCVLWESSSPTKVGQLSMLW